jgi:hypothetical protein
MARYRCWAGSEYFFLSFPPSFVSISWDSYTLTIKKVAKQLTDNGFTSAVLVNGSADKTAGGAPTVSHNTRL